MNRKEFDQLFDQAFDDATHSSQFVPDPGPSWAKIEKKLARRAANKRRLKLVPYVAASFLLGAYLFGTPSVSTAFKPVIEAATTIRDGVLEITIGRPKLEGTIPKTAPPPGFLEDDGSDRNDGEDLQAHDSSPSNHATLKAAAKHLDFVAPEIRYVPEGYEISKIDTYRILESDKDNQLSVLYERKSGETSRYRIVISRWAENSQMKITADDPGVAMETTAVNGYEAYLQLTNEGYASLQYFADDLYISIIGVLDREEIMEIGRQITLD